MSRTHYIHFRDQGFWAYDVPTSVFLKHLIDAAKEYNAKEPVPWLTQKIEEWQFNAVCTDLGVYLDNDWTSAQVDVVVALCEHAIAAIRGRRDFSGSEIGSWPMQDDQRIFPRGHDSVPREPVARLGEAIAAVLRGTLPPSPEENKSWFYTLDDELRTL